MQQSIASPGEAPSGGNVGLPVAALEGEGGESGAPLALEADAADSESSGGRGVAVTATAIVLVLFLRIFAVADWQWDTAAELAETFSFDDAVPILMGTLFEMPILTGIAAGLLAPLTAYRLVEIRRSKLGSTKLTDILLMLLLATIIFVLVRSGTLWWPALVALVASAACVVGVRFLSGRKGRAWLGRLSSRAPVMALAVFLFLAVTVTTPWNPKERLTLGDGVLVGHVIEVSPGFLKVLTEEREVLTLLTGEVLQRETLPAN